MTTIINDSCFGTVDLRRARARLGVETKRAATMEACAQTVCTILFEELRSSGPSQRDAGCALVRCFKTHRYGGIEPELQRYCRTRLDHSGELPADLPCLVLLGSAGDEHAWRSRRSAGRHRVMPIPDQRALETMPMVAELFRQFDVRLEDVRPRRFAVAPETRSFGVFHIENAVDNPYVPDQAGFVRPYGIASVLGFGGPLRRGDLFAVLMFCKRPVAHEVALQLRHLALDVTAKLFHFEDHAVFDT